MKKALRNIVIAMTLIFTSNLTVLAVGVNGGSQQKKDSLTKVQTGREEIETKIEEFDNEIQKNMAKTKENKVKIVEAEKAAVIAAKEIKQVEKEAEKEQVLFNSRIRTMYMNGFDGYTSIILQSESFGDFVSRVENIKTVIAFDKKIVDGFENTKRELNEKQKNLNITKKKLLVLQSENKQKLDKIIISKESQNKLLSELGGNGYLAASQTSNTKVSITGSASRYTPSRGSAAVSDNAVIAYASKFLGTPYLWGGTSPSGFDCSGFTQYVYAHFGISLGRTTFDQIKNGVQVSRGNLQTGDLVFFGTFQDPHHMGIYVGNNTYIHAPRTGDVLKVSPMTRSDFVTGRRVK
ncbi:C40 family peptidase [Clostridium lacusfryxellense]|uniref:C40 family peptidase n=1 Tax=Clostridium lacusfryxellense TaxID=205328 RepID=UPI001C0B9F51|nr:C40 family peptidase [Clostridium lacusfryxellense]MBU3111505.1 C40 family peptidase [Clostridium lacusfryxellense]